MNGLERTRELLDYIEDGVSPFHVIMNTESYLIGAGFTKLVEQEHWNLVPGGKYFVTRNDSSLIAFAVPREDYHGFQIIAGHCDSPTFKIKEMPEINSTGLTRLNVERYGGMIVSTWFDRPLSVAGRVLVRDERGVHSLLYQADRDLVMIPNLAIHMNRDVNEGHKYDIQKELMPIFGAQESSLKKYIAGEIGVREEDILGMDLSLYNRDSGSIWGAESQFCSAPRLDDLQCVYGALQGFLEAMEEWDSFDGRTSENIPVYAVFDNEEVGSTTKQGAESTLLFDTLTRINACMGRNAEEYCMSIADSFMISADNAHGIHPNYPEKADCANYPVLNGGIVIKYNANQKYTTDAVSAAVLRKICIDELIPVQSFANNSNIAGGSTLGNISNTQVSLNTVDIGLAQWAMHSAYETAGTEDTEYLVRMSKAFYESTIVRNEEGYSIR